MYKWCLNNFTALNSCAVVADLQRTQHGPFTIEDTVGRWTVDNIKCAILKSRERFNNLSLEEKEKLKMDGEEHRKVYDRKWRKGRKWN